MAEIVSFEGKIVKKNRNGCFGNLRCERKELTGTLVTVKDAVFNSGA